MNTQRFMVEIVTSEKITTEDDINAMQQKIAQARVDGINGHGLCPEDGDACTQIVYVKGWYSDKQIIEHV